MLSVLSGHGTQAGRDAAAGSSPSSCSPTPSRGTGRSVDRFARRTTSPLDETPVARCDGGARSGAHRGRVLGATGGALVGARARDRVRLPQRLPVVALTAVLVGTFLGIAVAQRRRPRATNPCEPRRWPSATWPPTGPRRCATIVVGLLLATSGYAALVIGFAEHSTAIVAASARRGHGRARVIVAAGAGRSSLVGRGAGPRPGPLDPGVDDALRVHDGAGPPLRDRRRAAVRDRRCGASSASSRRCSRASQVGDRDRAFRFPAPALRATAPPTCTSTADVVTVTWRDAARRRTPRPRRRLRGARGTVGRRARQRDAHGDRGLATRSSGSSAAFFQWGAASKAWRRPSPAAPTAAPAAPAGSRA